MIADGIASVVGIFIRQTSKAPKLGTEDDPQPDGCPYANQRKDSSTGYLVVFYDILRACIMQIRGISSNFPLMVFSPAIPKKSSLLKSHQRMLAVEQHL